MSGLAERPAMPATVAEATGGGSRVVEVVSPSGIRAWLVEAPSIPILSLSLRFRGGAAMDPAGLTGLATMTASTIDEGAGPYDSEAFRAELEDHAIRLHFHADRDSIDGELKTLTAHRDHAFELLRLALVEPRFDAEPVDRVRHQLLAELRQRQNDPDVVAARSWSAHAFPDHPYGRPVRGTPETLAAIGRDDLVQVAKSRFARDNLLIGVAGDIRPDELSALLERTFAGLPAHALLVDVPKVEPRLGDTLVVPMPIPQSVVSFGSRGVHWGDPDEWAAYVANYILGGGGFSSRLLDEVREKRGLAYSVHSQLHDSELCPLWRGGLATRNDQVKLSIELVRQEMARFAAGEIEEPELTDAKTYLTGSFPLRLTSNDPVAKLLVGMQLMGRGLDYLDRRNSHIEAVTLDDVRRVAARLFAAPMLVTVVGQPQGIDDAIVQAGPGRG